MLKVRIVYEKKGFLSYIGHRDWINFIQRAIRRAGLPFSITKGFTPRIKINFSPALPLGVESECEYFDIELNEWVPKEEIVKRLKAEVYEEMKIKRIIFLPEGKFPDPKGCIYRDRYGNRIIQIFGKDKLEKKDGLVRIEFIW